MKKKLDLFYFSIIFQLFGKAGIYLEDLYIRPQFRGRGYGKATIKKLANIAVERGCGCMEWRCLDWNKSSMEKYKRQDVSPVEK